MKCSIEKSTLLLICVIVFNIIGIELIIMMTIEGILDLLKEAEFEFSIADLLIFILCLLFDIIILIYFICKRKSFSNKNRSCLRILIIITIVIAFIGLVASINALVLTTSHFDSIKTSKNNCEYNEETKTNNKISLKRKLNLKNGTNVLFKENYHYGYDSNGECEEIVTIFWSVKEKVVISFSMGLEIVMFFLQIIFLIFLLREIKLYGLIHKIVKIQYAGNSFTFIKDEVQISKSSIGSENEKVKKNF